MMIDTLKRYWFERRRLLRRDSRDMVFLFGDKVCNEGGGGRTIRFDPGQIILLFSLLIKEWLMKRSAYLRPSLATSMTITAWPADIWHD
jgi:hypothetical protein